MNVSWHFWMRLKVNNKDLKMKEEILMGIYELLRWKSSWSWTGRIIVVAQESSVTDNLQRSFLLLHLLFIYLYDTVPFRTSLNMVGRWFRSCIEGGKCSDVCNYRDKCIILGQYTLFSYSSWNCLIFRNLSSAYHSSVLHFFFSHCLPPFSWIASYEELFQFLTLFFFCEVLDHRICIDWKWHKLGMKNTLRLMALNILLT